MHAFNKNSKPRLRIALISNSFPITRSGRVITNIFLADFVDCLIDLNVDVQILIPRRPEAQDEKYAARMTQFSWSGDHTIALGKIKLSDPRGLFQIFSLFKEGKKAALDLGKKFQPDFCLAAFATPSGYYAWNLWKKQKIPFGVWCLGSDIHTWARKPGVRQLTRRILKDASLLYADGLALADEASVLADQKCEFLASARLQPTSTKALAVSNDFKTHFLYAGRWEKIKGLDILLEAWKLAALQDSCLHIAGHGEGLHTLVEEYSRDPQLQKSIRVWGGLNPEELYGLYKAVDCVVLPSRNESIPVVLSECIQMKLPMIVTDVGDMGTLIRRYNLGEVVASENTQQLSQALQRFSQIGAKQLHPNWVEAQAAFDIRHSAETLVRDIESVLRSNSKEYQ